MNKLLDTALDRAVVPGYSRIGYWLRRRGWPEDDPRPGSLAGRRALVTGANSGLGKATALGLARLGAAVHLVVRNEERGAAALEEVRRAVPDAELHLELCDMSDLTDVRRAAADLVGAPRPGGRAGAQRRRAATPSAPSRPTATSSPWPPTSSGRCCSPSCSARSSPATTLA